MSTVYRAVRLAAEWHGGQTYGSYPYMVHLFDVSRLCRPFGETAEICGFLHDILEDTDCPAAGQLEAHFGREVRAVVEAVTDPPGANRKERKAAANAKLAAIDGASPLSLALIVKAADRLANVRASIETANAGLLEMYRREHVEFVKAVSRPNHGAVVLLDETTVLLGEAR